MNHVPYSKYFYLSPGERKVRKKILLKRANKRYLAKHPERRKATMERWLNKNGNREKLLQWKRDYHHKDYAKRGPLILARTKAWLKAHPEVVTARNARRRLMQKNATVNLALIRKWMLSVKSKTYARCYYCQCRLRTDKIHFDHIIALAKGGLHSVENLCVSCRFCNQSKSDRPIRLMMSVDQTFLEL